MRVSSRPWIMTNVYQLLNLKRLQDLYKLFKGMGRVSDCPDYLFMRHHAYSFQYHTMLLVLQYPHGAVDIIVAAILALNGSSNVVCIVIKFRGRVHKTFWHLTAVLCAWTCVKVR